MFRLFLRGARGVKFINLFLFWTAYIITDQIMKRRSFISHSAAIPVVVSAGLGLDSKIKERNSKAYPFKMKYAPHLGMFKHHAGDDPYRSAQFYG